MPTAYAFTTEQLTEINRLRDVLSLEENKTTPSAAVPLYSYVFQCITGLQAPQSTPLDFLTQPFVSGVLAALPADQRASAIWLYGAIQVNSDNGVFSEVIRQYNVHQGELRGYGEFSASQLQETSNAVGILFANSILDETLGDQPNLIQGRLPTVQEIGASDLLGVRDVLYPGNEQPGSELYLNQAWPGIVMLGALGGQYTDRLLRWNEDQQAVELDSLADLKSLLLCWDSFKTAFSSTFDQSLSIAAASDFLIGLNLLPSVVSSALTALSQHGVASFAQVVFSALVQPQNGVASEALNLIARFDSPLVLDLLIGARTGAMQIGATTAANFAQRIDQFFSGFSAPQLLGTRAELLPVDATSIAQLASQDSSEGLRARAALRALSPFAVDVLPQAAVNLSLFNPETEEGEITAQWIEDRAKVHAAFNLYWRRGETDGLLSVTEFGLDLPFAQWGDTKVVVEAGNGAQELIIDGLDLGIAPTTWRYFGNDQDNQGSGGDAADRLYGGAGDDTLSGLDGADYMEGNAGADTLDGGAGRDTLLGGAGDDQLTAGAGDDLLKGGTGEDTYLFDGSAGTDTIEDSDGGSIRYQDNALAGGKRVAPGQQEWKDEHVTYRLVDDGSKQNLVITAGAGTLIVKDWANGRFGIQLQDAPEPPPPVTPNVVVQGDKAPVDTDPAAADLQLGYDLLGNVLVTAGASANRADTLFDSEGHDQLSGHGGADTLDAWRGGNDTLNGGAGDDHVLAGNGEDQLIGGEGLDRLLGQGGKDKLFAAAEQSDAEVQAAHTEGETEDTNNIAGQGELLAGGDNEDWLVGAQRADLLLGGRGKDTLWGGAGDDFLRGDSDATAVQANWQLTRWLETAPDNNTEYRHQVSGASYTSLAWPEGEADVLRGGAGDDWIFGQGGQDQLHGGSGNDALFGGEDSDWLEGGSGDDVMVGDNGADSSQGHGHDWLSGGAGRDTLWGDAGHDVLLGGDDNDALVGDSTSQAVELHGDDWLEGGQGEDTLVGAGGADTLLGGDDDDMLTGDNDTIDAATHGDDWLDGEKGNDSLFGDGGADTLLGGEGNDQLLGDALEMDAQHHGDDSLEGGEGSDHLYGTGGADTLLGGAGADWLYGDDENGEIDLSAHGKDVLDGGEGDDTLHGGGGDDMLAGGAGNDHLLGGDGRDTLVGGAGRDVMGAVSGDDVVRFGRGDGQDSVGLASATTLELGEGVGINDVSLKRNGTTELVVRIGLDDEIVFFHQGAGGGRELQAIRFADGTVWSYHEIEARLFTGTTADDVLIAYAHAPATMSGGHGNDSLTGSTQADLLDGGEADDSLYGGEGDNTLRGGDGNDRLVGGWDTELLQGGAGDDFIWANANPQYQLRPVGADTLEGGEGNDYLIGDTRARAIMFFEAGFGSDFIATPYDGTGTFIPSTVRFGASLGPGDIAVSMGRNEEMRLSTPDGHVVSFRYQTDLEPGSPTPASPIDRVEFSDGTVWSLSDMLARLEQAATFADDLLVGSTGSQEIYALAGADEVFGGDGNDTLHGGQGNDDLYGESGDDVLIGGGGSDRLYGGVGDDTYRYSLGDGGAFIVDDAGTHDVLELLGGITPEDLLLVRRAPPGEVWHYELWLDEAGVEVALMLSSGIEQIVFSDGSVWNATDLEHAASAIHGTAGNDSLTGTSGDDRLYGYASNDTLVGNAGNDLLDGGTGADSLRGGTGNDTYLVDAVGDVVVESSGQGTDTVLASVSHTLAANVEHLTLTGEGSTSGTGNALANLIVGNAGNNTLDGSTGNDTLQGGLGNDTYVVAQTGDVVTENANEGIDTVSASITWTLGNHVENITLTGTSAIHATGNALDNHLIGNSGNNSLTGNAGHDTLDGGAGTDTMRGGLGDDTYVVERTADVVTENANEGNDTVQTSVTLTLGSNFENITLTGSSAIHGTGNTLNNQLTGNSGANSLSGGAGHDTLWGMAGSDTLIGGTGNDTYLLGRGDGAETVQENDSTSGNFDVMRFLQDVAIDQVWFRRVSNNLEVSIIGTGDKTTITNWYSGNQYKLEQFQVSDGQALANAQVDALVQAMAAFAPPPMGQTTLNNDQQAALAPVIAASWN